MAKDAAHLPPGRLEAYERLVATVPGLERKGAKLPYTSVNGHMTSFLAEDGTLALRLSASDRARFLHEHDASLHVAHGTTMKEYVSVPDPLVGDVEALGPWFAASYAYVAALRPKPTRHT